MTDRPSCWKCRKKSEAKEKQTDPGNPRMSGFCPIACVKPPSDWSTLLLDLRIPAESKVVARKKRDESPRERRKLSNNCYCIDKFSEAREARVIFCLTYSLLVIHTLSLVRETRKQTDRRVSEHFSRDLTHFTRSVALYHSSLLLLSPGPISLVDLFSRFSATRPTLPNPRALSLLWPLSEHSKLGEYCFLWSPRVHAKWEQSAP